MRIPTVTDLMLERALVVAASPVAVLFMAGDADRLGWIRNRFQFVADQYDDRVIFLEISADENPTPAFDRMVGIDRPQIVIYRRAVSKGRLVDEFTADLISHLIEAVLEEHYR